MFVSIAWTLFMQLKKTFVEPSMAFYLTIRGKMPYGVPQCAFQLHKHCLCNRKEHLWNQVWYSTPYCRWKLIHARAVINGSCHGRGIACNCVREPTHLLKLPRLWSRTLSTDLRKLKHRILLSCLLFKKSSHTESPRNTRLKLPNKNTVKSMGKHLVPIIYFIYFCEKVSHLSKKRQIHLCPKWQDKKVSGVSITFPSKHQSSAQCWLNVSDSGLQRSNIGVTSYVQSSRDRIYLCLRGQPRFAVSHGTGEVMHRLEMKGSRMYSSPRWCWGDVPGPTVDTCLRTRNSLGENSFIGLMANVCSL